MKNIMPFLLDSNKSLINTNHIVYAVYNQDNNEVTLMMTNGTKVGLKDLNINQLASALKAVYNPSKEYKNKA